MGRARLVSFSLVELLPRFAMSSRVVGLACCVLVTVAIADNSTTSLRGLKNTSGLGIVMIESGVANAGKVQEPSALVGIVEKEYSTGGSAIGGSSSKNYSSNITLEMHNLAQVTGCGGGCSKKETPG